jgi:peroxiredoxin Q/BCP
MRRFAAVCLSAGALMAGMPRAGAAQDQPRFLAVGEMAPNIQLEGATRYGVVSDPISLNEYRGETLVLAFFFRARSSG